MLKSLPFFSRPQNTGFNRLADSLVSWAPQLMLVVLVLYSFLNPQLPVDDLLRHVVSYAWGYSHAAMYPLSSQTAYSQYPLFEWLVGHLSLALDPLSAVKVVQLAASALVIPAVYAAFHRLGAGRSSFDARWDALVLTLVVLAAGLYTRVFLARPEVFVLGWALFALSLRAGPKNPWYWLWLACAPAAIASYWLAWLTWPLLFVAQWSMRQRVLTVLGLSALHATFWLVFTDGDYLHVLQRLSSWNSARLITVNECLPVILALANPATLAAVALAGLGWKTTPKVSRVECLAALAPYAVLNMTRYVGAMAMGSYQLLHAGWSALQWRGGLRLATALVLFMAVIASVKPAGVPLFKLPAGSRVLSPFSVPVFSLPLANPGTVEVLPAMEVGASNLAVQELVKGLDAGTLDCGPLKTLGVTHVVEDRLKGVAPACLKYEQSARSWRLWSVQ